MSQPVRPELLALLAAVKEAPEDAAPRLILADWLEENGDEHDRARAELLRLHVAPGQAPAAGLAWERQERQNDLLRRHAAHWLGPLPKDAKGWSVLPGGLLGLVMYAGTLLRLQEEEGLAEQEAWAWVAELRLWGLEADLLSNLLAGPLLAGPAVLSLSRNPLGAAGVRQLLACPRLDRLVGLDLSETGLGVKRARVLAAAVRLPHLCRLRLGNNDLGDEGTQALAGSPGLAGLTYLGLSSNGIGDAGARALAHSAHLARLTQLDLSGNEIGDAGARTLAETAHLPSLTTLALRLNPRISEQGKRLLRQRFGATAWGLVCDPPRP
jgi:uncharacterized protein (TIGR02996 family)